MTPAKLYIWIISIGFAILAGIMLFMPRSVYSNLEKRDLKEFPEYNNEKLKSGDYARELSGWFSDTEPYRDDFMSASMKVRDLIRYSFVNDEDAVSFHAVEGQQQTPTAPPPGADAAQLEEYENHINADENAKIGSSGIIIVGSGKNVRALNAFGGSAAGGGEFAKAVSEYKKEMPDVNVYAMVIPLSSEFYTPDKAKSVTNPQQPFIKNLYSKLENGARGVNAYNALADHVDEDIYLRTDHHWAPLGAYYAAQEFAKTAGVPFKPLSSYTKNVIHNFVGSMYGYSNDISVKNAPEDFIYYTPNGINYTTTYWIYDVNKDYKVTGERKPFDGQYFAKFKDGSGAAYSTFMGGDQKLTKVKTGANPGRRLMVIKDSYGNALPGYLFYSFDEIHIVDFRYFTRNMKKYVRDNKITDIVFCVNVFNAYSSSVARKINVFLGQHDGAVASSSSENKSSEGEHHKEKESEKEKSEPKKEQSKKSEPVKIEPSSEPVQTEEPVAAEPVSTPGNEDF